MQIRHFQSEFHRCRWAVAYILLACLTVPSCTGQVHEPQNQAQKVPSPVFGESEALVVLGRMQQAMESMNRKKFLELFDAPKMSNFPSFRGQVSQLFQRYDSFAVAYHVMETGTEGNNAVALVDFGLDGAASSDEAQDLSRHAQLRLVLDWNGKDWKIVDVSPRALFQ